MIVNRWRQRVVEVMAKVPLTVERDTEKVPAAALRTDDVFDFAGATLRAETITYIGSLIEIEAVGPFNITTLHYLPFESVTVFLPRPQVPA